MSASLAPECNEVKDESERHPRLTQHRQLFELTYTFPEYLRGAEKDNKECADLFNEYQKCLGVALKSRGIDKLLDEAREDNKDNDVRLTAPRMDELVALQRPAALWLRAIRDLQLDWSWNCNRNLEPDSDLDLDGQQKHRSSTNLANPLPCDRLRRPHTTNINTRACGFGLSAGPVDRHRGVKLRLRSLSRPPPIDTDPTQRLTRARDIDADN
ncbi:hypothetical protein MKX07_007117 [Trichoderma sp. CBMAI-0711]|nr:hypothetical protein MKX07_007117 [Trichoderma sp. CBMAI-0711]